MGKLLILVEVLCACGCGRWLNPKAANGLRRRFINGHNGRKSFAPDRMKMCRKRWRKANPISVRETKKAFYRRRKLMAMAYLGNQCYGCGVRYDGTNAPIFEFHHRDPEVKDSGLTRLLTNATWERIREELDKCQLRCANCHNLFHGGSW